MVNINKKYLEEKLEKEIWNGFLKEISSPKSGKELKTFLGKFFTQSEVIMLEKRLAIMNLLSQKKRYSDIAKIIDVSSSTISFVTNGFKNKPAKKKRIYSVSKISNSSKFIERKFPAYRGRGRWTF